MKEDKCRLHDTLHVALERARALKSESGIIGYGVVELFGPDGELKYSEPFVNLITTVGDEYYARRAAAGIGTPNLAQPTLANGMKLGTGTTAEAKSGAGAALVTYETASNNLFDATHPALINETGDTGWSVEYKTSWAAGDVTDTALREVVIVTDAATNATSTAANTISRALFGPVNKGSSDSLVITWKHTFNAS